jgi:hypothetical protein
MSRRARLIAFVYPRAMVRSPSFAKLYGGRIAG